MFAMLDSLLRLLISPPSLHDLALENLALRQQLAVFKRKCPRPRLRAMDRFFWVWLSRSWKDWRRALVIVRPETVVAWHGKGFRLFWTWISRRRTGRPEVTPAIRALILKMAAANPIWGAPRIHGELLKLGIHISERTVSRVLPRNVDLLLKPGGSSSTITSTNWSPSISSRCRPRPFGSCSFWWSWRIVGAM